MELSKAYKKWMDRIHDTRTPWAENEIIYFRKALSSSGIQSEDEKYVLHKEFDRKASRAVYRIHSEQDLKGQKYLLNKSLSQKDLPRKNCKLGEYELQVIKDLEYHNFIGIYQPQANLQYYLPIYRAYSHGKWFDYVGTVYEHIVVLGIGSKVSLHLIKDKNK